MIGSPISKKVRNSNETMMTGWSISKEDDWLKTYGDAAPNDQIGKGRIQIERPWQRFAVGEKKYVTVKKAHRKRR